MASHKMRENIFILHIHEEQVSRVNKVHLKFKNKKTQSSLKINKRQEQPLHQRRYENDKDIQH